MYKIIFFKALHYYATVTLLIPEFDKTQMTFESPHLVLPVK